MSRREAATAHRRLRQWQAGGTWERIRQILILDMPDATIRDASASAADAGVPAV